MFSFGLIYFEIMFVFGCVDSDVIGVKLFLFVGCIEIGCDDFGFYCMECVCKVFKVFCVEFLEWMFVLGILCCLWISDWFNDFY